MSSHAEINARHMGILWMLSLNEPLPLGSAPRVAATFQNTGPELAEELAAAMGFASPEPVLLRFALGRRCFIARVAGQLAAYGWQTFDEEGIGELGLRMRLLPGEVYIWDCATLPTWRGQRLYPALLTHMLNDLQHNGLQRAWIGMDADNLPSQTGAALAGFQPIIDILLSREPKTHRFIARGYPDVPEEHMRDAQYALFGDRDISNLAISPSPSQMLQ
ncbi:MAG: GNAT family N-acetyltransferase [Ktedonobacteraceae bacterium]